jgi:hypothetical protein
MAIAHHQRSVPGGGQRHRDRRRKVAVLSWQKVLAPGALEPDELSELAGRLQRRAAPRTKSVADVADETIGMEASPAGLALQMGHQDGARSPSAQPLRALPPCHPAMVTRWTG